MICHFQNRCVHWPAPALILHCIVIYSSHHILIKGVLHTQGHSHNIFPSTKKNGNIQFQGEEGDKLTKTFERFDFIP